LTSPPARRGQRIAAGKLAWADIFEDGNVVWALRPQISWRQ
jgi:hypothetical protein